MTPLGTSLSMLSAIITPSLLILACASLIGATAQRLSRVIDKAHRIAQEFQQWAESSASHPLYQERRRLLFVQLERLTQRSRILQQTMTLLYMSLSCLIGTSVVAGVVAVVGRLTWLPIPMGLLAVACLFYASLVLIRESRLAMASVNDEMDLVLQLSPKVHP